MLIPSLYLEKQGIQQLHFEIDSNRYLQLMPDEVLTFGDLACYSTHHVCQQQMDNGKFRQSLRGLTADG